MRVCVCVDSYACVCMYLLYVDVHVWCVWGVVDVCVCVCVCVYIWVNNMSACV